MDFSQFHQGASQLPTVFRAFLACFEESVIAAGVKLALNA